MPNERTVEEIIWQRAHPILNYSICRFCGGTWKHHEDQAAAHYRTCLANELVAAVEHRGVLREQEQANHAMSDDCRFFDGWCSSDYQCDWSGGGPSCRYHIQEALDNYRALRASTDA